jgi:hypothetical protein
MKATYHRLSNAPKKNQNLETAVLQINSRKICGGISFNSPGGPAVKAYEGPLLDNQQGIEFETDVLPTPGCSIPGGDVYWYYGLGNPNIKLDATGNLACIDVVITKVRYTTNAQIAGGIDLKF